MIKRLFDFLDLERCKEETFHISTDYPISGTSLYLGPRKMPREKKKKFL